jgi:hypothetical protein
MSSLHDRIARVLGWSPTDVRSLSLQSLRDLVRPINPNLARELDLVLSRPDRLTAVSRGQVHATRRVGRGRVAKGGTPARLIETPTTQGDWLSREILETAVKLGGGHDRRVMITDLRRAIPEVGRMELDAALLDLSADGRIALFPNDDRWSISPEDRRDAVDLSGVAQHIIYVPSRK